MLILQFVFGMSIGLAIGVPCWLLGRFLVQGGMIAGQWFLDGMTSPEDVY